MKKVAIILIVLTMVSGSMAADKDTTVSEWEYLKQGPYEVGYVEMKGEIADSIRLVNEFFRKVAIAAWYPDIGNSRGLAKKEVPKEFPVILLCPMIEAKLNAYTTIVKYLASHGFVVGTFPSSGDDYTGGHPAYRTDFRQLQLDYLQIALARVTNLDVASKEKIGVMGHSYGGPAAINMALTEKKIDAVVSLDGTDACLDYTKQMADQFPYYDPANLKVPYMLLLADLSYCTGEKRSFEFLDGIVGQDTYVAEFHNLDHGHFAFSIIYKPDPLAKKSFEIACLYMLNFFKANLYGDAKAKEWLAKSPKDIGFPTELFDYRSKSN